MDIHKGSKKAVIVGATGLIGQHLLRLVLSSDAYDRVTIIVRKKTTIDHPQLRQVVIDFEHLVDQAYEHMACDDLYVCLGTTIKNAKSKENFYRVDYKYVILVAEMAHRQGARILSLVSSAGADPDSKVFYSRVKGQVEQTVCRMPYWAIHIFRPSLLLGRREESRPLESSGKLVARGLASILGNKMGRMRPVEGYEVAKAMVVLAQQIKPGLQVVASDQIHTIAKRGQPQKHR
jgi:uncharacterized protein YbjT (DUF2867 family)